MPEDAVTFNNRGNAKFKLKEYTGAMEDYDEAIKLDSKIGNAYINRGILKERVKDKRVQ